MLKQLRIKFVCITMVILTLLLGVILGLLVYFTGLSLEQESIQFLRSISEGPPGNKPMGALVPYFSLQLRPNGDWALMDGGLYSQTGEEFVNEALTAALSDPQQVGTLPAQRLRFFKHMTPVGQSIAFADISREQSTLAQLLRNCLLIGAVSFGVFLLMCIWLARWAVRPVERAWEQQRQFLADASHELKTPLTVITTNAELLQAPGYGEGERAQFSQSILTMTRRMRGLVEGMLELARVDNGTAVLDFQPLSLSELTADALLPFEPLFFEQGFTLVGDIAPDLRVKGSPARLSQVVEILLDNARKYSSPDGQTHVTLSPAPGNRCVLTVANTGQAIPDEARRHIFERFYRVDKARSASQGYGLGLAIAQSTVTLHGGKIWYDYRDGFNCFSVELPLI